jgi:hypothetical protein
MSQLPLSASADINQDFQFQTPCGCDESLIFKRLTIYKDIPNDDSPSR